MTTGVLAWVLFGLTGLLWALVVGALIGVLQPRMPTRTLLSMYGALPVGPASAPGLVRMLRELSKGAGLARTPTLYYLPSTIPNAFAVGRGDDVAIAISDGLLRILTTREVAAVLAHEVSHVRSGDTTIMSLSDTAGRFVQWLSYAGVLLIFVTLPMTLGGDADLLLVSLHPDRPADRRDPHAVGTLRDREYDADLEGATLIGDPEALVSALESLERSAGRIWERLLVRRGRVPDPLLLRTHPSTADCAIQACCVNSCRSSRRACWATTGRHDRQWTPRPWWCRPRLRFPGVRW